MRIKFLHFIEDDKGIGRVAAQILYRIDIGIATKWGAMCLDIMLVTCTVFLQGAFAHCRVANNECRSAFFLLGGTKCLAYFFRIVAVDGEDIPIPRPVLGGRVFGHDSTTLCRQLNVIGVIEHDKIVQSKRSGKTSDALGYFFLNAAIRNIGVYLMLHDGPSQPCFQEFLRNGGTCGKGMSLSQWPGSVFYASGNVTLRVAWSRGAPLPELLQLFEREFSLQSQSGV